MMDVSQVLEFPLAKLCLLKQLPISKITQISTSKLTLNQSRLFGGWVLNGGSVYYTTKISKKELHKRKTCLKYSSLRYKNYRNLTILSRGTVFTLRFLMKKYISRNA